jgi:uncharacterized protein YndB with AHSA1/START domain
VSGPGSLQIEHILPAPPEDVFAAWTTPERMARWMSPEGSAQAQADPRVGGVFRVIMGEHEQLEHTGEYLEVDPPRRLVFTWASPSTGPEPSEVTVELHPHEDSTRLVLTHEKLPAEAVDGHRNGWGTMLDLLAEVVRA